MSIFPQISDERLLIALIRKLRIRKVVSGGRTAPEGTLFKSVLTTAVGANLFKQKEFDDLVRALVREGFLSLSGHISFYNGESQKHNHSDNGKIASLHPDASVLEYQFFTENWTPIVARKSNEDGRRIYPHKNMSYNQLRIKMVYVVGDGLPRSFTGVPIIYPVS